MMKKLLTFLVCLSLVTALFPQNQANIWYFNKLTGMDFNTGEPEIIHGPILSGCTSTMSDTAGNLLLTANANSIWNRNLAVMQNGEEIAGHTTGPQSCLIVQKPGSDYLYYVFTAGSSSGSVNPPVYGLFYSVVDITLDNGMGAVTNEKNVPLNSAWDATDKIYGLQHANGKDIWIITYKHKECKYATYHLTEAGIEDNPVISNSVYRPEDDHFGGMVISFNKKYLIAAFNGSGSAGDPDNTSDICKFNAATGEIEFLYALEAPSDEKNYGPSSVAFSPDSKLAYITYLNSIPAGWYYNLYQYDVSQIESQEDFSASAIFISEKGRRSLQLARDGKIYCKMGLFSIGPGGIHDKYLTIIHEPWKRGTDCKYEDDAISVEGYEGWGFLPNNLLDYYYRFEWEGRCQNKAFVFQPNFIPDPEYIIWNFGDPASGSNNHSYELHPTHLFSGPGEFEVSVYLEYPNERVEQTSRVVTVSEAPQADLGGDTLTCELSPVTLNAGDGPGFYSWSTGAFGENANEITVSDTGTYWVRVEWNDCVAYDTIYVGMFTKPEINQDNLVLTPTACAGETGAITGLNIIGIEPLNYYWYDGSGTLLDSTLDLYNLAAGNCFLHIIDGNGCTTISNSYTILDAGEVEITTVNKQDTHCNQQTGTITITANTPIPGELLYSIDNGNTWQNGNNTFSNLSAGDYFVRVKDENDCEGIWENNPVVIDNIDGPQLSSATTLPEIDHLSNGEIDLQASISTGDLHYSINNGTSFQINDGHFSNLSAGIYHCVIKDDFGCDTSFVIEVELVISQLIDAIAGNGYTCIGNATVVPLILNNFTDIFSFNVKLTYDTAVLNCDGYINTHPVLEENIQISIVPGTDQIVVQWQGEQAETLEDNATMLKLVFTAKQEGVSGIDWAAEEGESVFYNEQQEEINAEYHLGMLRVYTRPSIFIPTERQVCENEFFFMSAFVTGGTGDISYLWEGPDGYEHTGSFVEFENITHNQAGIYNLTVTDTINCVETEQVNVSVFDNPLIEFPLTDTIYEQPGFVLDAGGNYQNYLWNTGDTTHEIQIHDEGLYSVYVTSGEDCKSTDSVTVLWGQSAFYLPNAFTPNGDGLNDEFKPVQKHDFVNTYHLSIYSRWGEMIFETSDINRGWDGSYKGNPTQQGTYIYKIVYTAWPNKDEQKVVTGSVMLVR